MSRSRALAVLGLLFTSAGFVMCWRAWDNVFWGGYLVAFLFWLQFPLGCLALFLIHNLTGGGWGKSISAPLRAGSRALRFVAVLFVPLFFGARSLYPWLSSPELLKLDQGRYLNFPFFAARAALYLCSWAGLGLLADRTWSRTHQEPMPSARLQYLSAWGLVALALTVSFASFDWMMSLEPRWHSTVYGLMVITGQGVAALAWLLGYHCLYGKRAQDRQDIANLLLAYMMTWAYLAFMQYLIIWSGNLPAEASWYLHRVAGGWAKFPALLTVLGFALPFFFFLSRKAKRSAKAMLVAAALLLVSRAIDLYWMVMPALSPEVHRGLLSALLLWLGLGALSVLAYEHELARCA